MCIAGPEISSIYELNLHSIQPAGRNGAHVGQHPIGRRTVDGNKIVPTASAEQRRIRQGERFHPLQAPYMVCDLFPKLDWLRILSDGVDHEKPIRQKSGRLMRQSLK